MVTAPLSQYFTSYVGIPNYLEWISVLQLQVLVNVKPQISLDICAQRSQQML